MIERMGQINIESLLSVTTQERLLQYMRWYREQQMKVRFPICSRLANKRIETVATIQDLSGAHLGILTTQGWALLK
jgi:hypothetical protein